MGGGSMLLYGTHVCIRKEIFKLYGQDEEALNHLGSLQCQAIGKEYFYGRQCIGGYVYQLWWTHSSTRDF